MGFAENNPIHIRGSIIDEKFKVQNRLFLLCDEPAWYAHATKALADMPERKIPPSLTEELLRETYIPHHPIQQQKREEERERSASSSEDKAQKGDASKLEIDLSRVLKRIEDLYYRQGETAPWENPQKNFLEVILSAHKEEIDIFPRKAYGLLQRQQKEKQKGKQKIKDVIRKLSSYEQATVNPFVLFANMGEKYGAAWPQHAYRFAEALTGENLVPNASLVEGIHSGDTYHPPRERMVEVLMRMGCDGTRSLTRRAAKKRDAHILVIPQENADASYEVEMIRKVEDLPIYVAPPHQRTFRGIGLRGQKATLFSDVHAVNRAEIADATMAVLVSGRHGRKMALPERPQDVPVVYTVPS